MPVSDVFLLMLISPVGSRGREHMVTERLSHRELPRQVQEDERGGDGAKEHQGSRSLAHGRHWDQKPRPASSLHRHRSSPKAFPWQAKSWTTCECRVPLRRWRRGFRRRAQLLVHLGWVACPWSLECASIYSGVGTLSIVFWNHLNVNWPIRISGGMRFKRPMLNKCLL